MGKTMSKEESIARACDVLAENFDEFIPGAGRGAPLAVRWRWPDTAYEAVLRLEQDLTGPDDSCRLRPMMHEMGGDRAVSVYMAKGTGEELKAWLLAPKNRAELLNTLEALKKSVDNFD